MGTLFDASWRQQLATEPTIPAAIGSGERDGSDYLESATIAGSFTEAVDIAATEFSSDTGLRYVTVEIRLLVPS